MYLSKRKVSVERQLAHMEQDKEHSSPYAVIDNDVETTNYNASQTMSTQTSNYQVNNGLPNGDVIGVDILGLSDENMRLPNGRTSADSDKKSGTSTGGDYNDAVKLTGVKAVRS